eukprot:7499958-Ditylum_brightwellii.AAC.1
MPTSETNPPVKQSNNTMLSILLNMQSCLHLLSNNTEEDGKDNEDQTVTDNDNDGSDFEDPDNASQDQDQDTPPIHPSGININLPFPVINTMEQFDIFQV